LLLGFSGSDKGRDYSQDRTMLAAGRAILGGITNPSLPRARAGRAFFDLSQAFDDPLRYGESSRFETMPSRPNRQT